MSHATRRAALEAYWAALDARRAERAERAVPRSVGIAVTTMDVGRFLAVAPGGKPDWRDLAACAETDPEAFFPEAGGSVAEAKAICAVCPSRLACLEYSLERHEDFGVWGGLAEADRRRLRSRKQQREETAA